MMCVSQGARAGGVMVAASRVGRWSGSGLDVSARQSRLLWLLKRMEQPWGGAREQQRWSQLSEQ